MLKEKEKNQQDEKTIQTNPKESFLQQRLSPLGITTEDITVRGKQDPGDPAPGEYQLLTEDPNGNIIITYPTLTGDVLLFKKNGKNRPYGRVRFAPGNEKPDRKYETEFGASTQVFFPPKIIKAYQAKTPIETLFVVEGEFKAIAGEKNGLSIVAIPGIHSFTQKAGKEATRDLKQDLEDLIKTCKVKNLVLLFDGDCLQVKYESEEKDLFIRANSFYSAVKNFREYTKHLAVDVYLSHLKSELSAKGLDDLFQHLPLEKENITKDILSLARAKEYFVCQNISDTTLPKLQAYFKITDEKVFYNSYKEVLGKNIFTFKFKKYQHNGKSLEKVATTTSNNNGNNIVKNNFILLKEYMLSRWDFRYNSVRNEIEYKLKTDVDYELLNDSDVYVHLKENNVSFKENDLKAILKSSIMSAYNPIEDYFKELPKWDNVTDHIYGLINHVQYSGEIDLKLHFKKWLVRAVKCGVEKEYFNKQILVFIGKQNDGKSTFIRKLLPKKLENYYTENPDFKNKDGEISLTQNFIINMDELANISKEDTDKLKSFISKTGTNLRRPYERNTRFESRRASFAGSTNNDEFLTDHTGNVRWLIFKIDGIDFKYDKGENGKLDEKFMDKVWAQAYHIYNSEFDYEISKKEFIEIEKVNESYKIETAEMGVIKQFFKKAINLSEENAELLSANEIISYVESINPRYRFLRPVTIGKAMTSLGFIKTQQRRKDTIYPITGYLLIKI